MSGEGFHDLGRSDRALKNRSRTRLGYDADSKSVVERKKIPRWLHARGAPLPLPYPQPSASGYDRPTVEKQEEHIEHEARCRR